MEPVIDETVATLLGATKGPCISIYMPTHRHFPDAGKDAIRYKNVLKQVRDELGGKGVNGDAKRLLADLAELEGDRQFWNHQLDTLAVFKSPEVHIVKPLHRPTAEPLIEVANSFHVKPLIRLLQTSGRYQLLGISQKSVRVYEGDRDQLAELPLHPDVPRSLTDAAGEEIAAGEQSFSKHGGIQNQTMVNSHHDKSDDRDIDLEKFFLAVDGAVIEHFSRLSKLPLILAADVDYHHRFRKHSRNPWLHEKGIEIDPTSAHVSIDDLRRRAAEIIKQDYDRETRTLVDDFETAKAQQQATDDLRLIGMHAIASGIKTLIVDGDQQRGGRVDPETGDILFEDRSDPHVGDVLDDLAEMTLRRGGRVRVLPSDLMPSQTGAAAVLRYQLKTS